MILQSEVTLDECILHVNDNQPFWNGCNWAFYFNQDGSVEMGYGCYGVHVNLITGKDKLLFNYFCSEIEKMGGFDKDKLGYKSYNTDKRIKLNISPEVKLKLMEKKENCRHCGSPFFQEPKQIKPEPLKITDWVNANENRYPAQIH